MFKKLITILLISVLTLLKAMAANVPNEISSKNVKFYVQIGISPIPVDRGEYAKRIGCPTKSVSVFKYDGFYRYVVGETGYLDKAIESCDRLIKEKELNDLKIVGSIDDSYVEFTDLLARCIEEDSFGLHAPLEEKDTFMLNNSLQDEIVYHIQVLALSNKTFTSAKLSLAFALKEKVLVHDYEGMTHFMVGSEKNEHKARELLQSLKSKGISDAFIVAYQNGKRISLREDSN